MAASSPVCLMSKATSTKSWLWHRRLSHLNFGTINDLTRLDLVDGLPKFKYGKDHLCSACERGKSKKASHPPKLVPSDHSKLELLHMDLCGPMRVASINGKKYILVIVDDFSRYTWVYFLRSKDETPEIIKKFITQAQLNYKAKVCKIRTDNGTEFKNATLKAYYEKLGIMQQFSIARTPQQNGVVERRNRTLVEAARTMLIFSKLPEFLWAEAVATACFTQNRSIIHTRYNKTPYELLRGRKPNIAYFHVFGSLCYPTNDRDDLGKMKPKADIGVFIGYLETSIEDIADFDGNTQFVPYNPPIQEKIEKNITILSNGLSKQAFLNGPIERRKSMVSQPEGFIDPEFPNHKHGLDGCVSMSTPMATERLDAYLQGTPTDQTTYRHMIGGLMYLTASRPDIAFATFVCARYQACPTVKHLKEVKRIFRYLRQSYNMGLWYPKDSEFELIAYADADHAGCKDDCKSTSGGLQFLGGKLVS
ncbi:retrovirus-related pol polyprotein from transposon TNT 1-94 [Tanacetum coccineum]